MCDTEQMAIILLRKVVNGNTVIDIATVSDIARRLQEVSATAMPIFVRDYKDEESGMTYHGVFIDSTIVGTKEIKEIINELRCFERLILPNAVSH